ncbi:PREDICTED: programmed cell death protein 2 [Elephantulus edwardii]|uniref:programmed cell death protein 2 n=1 Tax=Elephantulus edwardii TaxID=28737 RepID=UPI0003F0E3FD|nr:PREDICTED: programmed cell death protein 2 [Elephantulus edwardii]
MAALPAPLVELGFAEEAPAWRLRSALFPSKVGGRPAWLGEAGLPGPRALSCPLCGRPPAFLLQLYAPLPGRADAFHRALFLFCCRDPSCCAGLRVFRNQLPRKNDFYSYDPPCEEPPMETEEPVFLQLKSGAHLCRVCGCFAPKTCSRCHKAHYCSKEHQTLDWRWHRHACTQAGDLDDSIPDHNFLFPEYEIVIEMEDEFPPEVPEEKDEMEPVESMDDALEEELESMAKHESKEDKIFQKFKTRIAPEPEQILRYGRGIVPVWISGENVPQEEDIPNCPCGSKRLFEFQVMPQLLNLLKADSLGRSIDWGILAIFTCEVSCALGTGYTEEFVWKQDVTDTA